MQYFVKRGEERFGPYSLTDLQKYLQVGNVRPDDLAQSEGMTDWVPVSQVVGNIPAPVATTGGAAAAPALAPELVPLPPNLHWSLVLILGLLTRQFFNLAWALVQGNWARKLTGDNKPMVLVAMYPAGIITGIVAGAMGQQFAILGLVLLFGGVVAYLFGIFAIKAAMEEYYNSTENIGLVLSGVMTFFFSTVYLQYHINSIHRWKKTGVLR